MDRQVGKIVVRLKMSYRNRVTCIVEQLKETLEKLILELKNSNDILTKLNKLVSVYPFNEYEYMISVLLGFNKLSLDEYYILRDEYIHRNLFLYIFEINAPRGFGEKWAQGHLKELVPELKKPSKLSNPNYSGQYDFWLDDKIAVEIKASRTTDSSIDAPLYEKALASNSKKPFLMNFQQIKPECCDVFI